MLVFTLGRIAVVHSSSERKRLNCALSSTGRPSSTTQVGASAEKCSLLLAANEVQASTLQLPGDPITPVSTW